MAFVWGNPTRLSLTCPNVCARVLLQGESHVSLLQPFCRRTLIRMAGPDLASADAEEYRLPSQVPDDLPIISRQTTADKFTIHTISILVVHEAGVLTRICNLVARRGFNINSLGVGPTELEGVYRITMTVPGDDRVLMQVSKQLQKLPVVLCTSDVTEIPTVDRELMLMKVSCESSAKHSQIFQLCKVFRARILDISNDCLIAEVTGDPRKVAAFGQMMAPFGVVESIRPGKVSICRGSNTLRHSSPNETVLEGFRVSPSPTLMGDIPAGCLLHTLNLKVKHEPGVLNRVCAAFARRGYSIFSLGVGPSEERHVYRITMTVPVENDAQIAHLCGYLRRLVSVHECLDITHFPSVDRELVLYKIACDSFASQAQVFQLAETFRARVVDLCPSSVVVELTGNSGKMTAFEQVIQQFGVLECVRPGKIALPRGHPSQYASITEAALPPPPPTVPATVPTPSLTHGGDLGTISHEQFAAPSTTFDPFHQAEAVSNSVELLRTWMSSPGATQPPPQEKITP